MKANKSRVLRGSIINALMRWIPAPQRRGERRENPESHLSSLAGSISAPPQRALRLCGAPMLLGVFCLLLWTLAPAQVPYKRIAGAGAEPGDWLTYSGDYQSQRLSRLAQITPANVGGLKTAWVYQFKQPGRQETSRSEEHTSELQSRGHLVCRLLLEKKKKKKKKKQTRKGEKKRNKK